MIKKKKKSIIDVNNINSDIIKHFYAQEIKTEVDFYRPQPFFFESCAEEIDFTVQNISNNIEKLKNISENETIKINPENINISILEFVMERQNIRSEYKEPIINKSPILPLVDIKDDIMDIFENIIKTETSIDKVESSNNESDTSDVFENSRINSLGADKRLVYFLKKTNPLYYKSCENVKDYVEKTEALIIEKGKNNFASQPIFENIKKYKKQHIKNNFNFKSCKLDFLNESFWTEEEKQKFKFLVFKYKNSFFYIKKEFPSKTMKDIILRYYMGKDKTWKYLKKRSGRISDTECENIISGTWSEYEKKYFDEKYPTYGKSLVKYQKVIPKTLKELKIYLNWYLKKQIITKRKVSTKIMADWSTDERQIFAIYYPFFNKNWITMSGHFSSKNSKDLKVYYTKYFKHLSHDEQRFETYLKDYNLKSRTDPVLHKGEECSNWCESVGWIFKYDK